MDFLSCLSEMSAGTAGGKNKALGCPTGHGSATERDAKRKKIHEERTDQTTGVATEEESSLPPPMSDDEKRKQRRKFDGDIITLSSMEQATTVVLLGVLQSHAELGCLIIAYSRPWPGTWLGEHNLTTKDYFCAHVRSSTQDSCPASRMANPYGTPPVSRCQQLSLRAYRADTDNRLVLSDLWRDISSGYSYRPHSCDFEFDAPPPAMTMQPMMLDRSASVDSFNSTYSDRFGRATFDNPMSTYLGNMACRLNAMHIVVVTSTARIFLIRNDDSIHKPTWQRELFAHPRSDRLFMTDMHNCGPHIACYGDFLVWVSDHISYRALKVLSVSKTHYSFESIPILDPPSIDFGKGSTYTLAAHDDSLFVARVNSPMVYRISLFGLRRPEYLDASPD